ncbi:MAG: AAA family ATPase [Planctomycetota bacterium]
MTGPTDPPEPIDVYLLAGQSNMSGAGRSEDVPAALREPHATALMYFAPLNKPGHDRLERDGVRRWTPLAPGTGGPIGGFGPELSFGHTVAAQTPDRRVALIKSDRGGSGMFNDWRPADRDDPSTLTNNMLRDAADAFEALLEAGHDARFAGFLWYQGERDTRPDAPDPAGYGPFLDTLCERLADELNDGADFAKVFFRVHPHDAEQPHAGAIRDTLVARAEADPRGAWVDVDDLTYPDRLHPDGPSLLTAGDRAAAAMLRHRGANDSILLPPGEGGPRSGSDEGGSGLSVDQAGESASARPHPDPLPGGEGAKPPGPQAPRPPAAPRVLALMNQKGGVGKTTTAVNVGAALAELGLRVLCVDLDPQAHLTLSLGIEPDAIEKSNYHLLTETDTTAMEVVRYTARDDRRLAVLPAETNLAGVESEMAELVATGLAQTVLRNKCRDLVKEFDYVLIDCPPSLGLLTINALTLAREIVVPMQAHFLALQGMTKLLETIGMVRQGINPSLSVAGVVLCMHEGNTLLANEVIGELEAFFDGARGTDQPWADGRVFTPPIRRNIKLAEAPSFGQSVHAYAPESNGAKDYLALARSIADPKDS